MRSKVLLVILSVFVIMVSGCGYTTSSLLSADLKSIHIDNFKNEINPESEVSDKRPEYSYWPNLENQIRSAVINDFLFDKTLKIEPEKDADLVLKGALTSFRKFPLSYDDDQNVEELRVEIYVDLELYNNLTQKVMWSKTHFMGEADYSVVGQYAVDESEAVKEAVDDLSQRIMERVIESW